MLPLTKIEQGHYGSFFVLGWISLKDLGDELLINSIELERYRRVIFWCVSVLIHGISACSMCG